MRTSPRRSRTAVSRKKEISALICALGSIGLFAAGTVFLNVTSIKGPDLSDLTPMMSDVDGYVLLSWSNLARETRPVPSSLARLAGRRVQVLGYMMTGEHPPSNRRNVHDFALLPDAGTALHPAHRLGDQMIAVSLKDNQAVPFMPKTLTWVRGTFHELDGDPSASHPLYVIERAETLPANLSDIRNYFKY
ncbi:MAG TPA: hypothetical protein VKU01_24695 [Bryobacteraceae bacterium]|nr:hypothetical protein [Bryobacteraceae bacterium]